ncbi:MAG: heavy metal-binding domain-containing protein [Bacteroidia bacterium]
MKKRILIAAAAASFAYTLPSCSSNGTKENVTVKTDTTVVKKTIPADTNKTRAVSDTTKQAMYECPMKCGNKTFAKPGKCPECGMTLVKVKS